MVTYGIDISHWQGGIDLREVASGTNVEFVIAKTSEGATVQDPNFAEFRAQAEETDLLFAGYHYLRGDVPIGDQVRNAKEALGDVAIPLILDIERTNGWPQPSMADAREFRDVAGNLGVRVSPLLYLPEWYWGEIGHPSTAGWDLWQSNYGSNDSVYPGNTSDRWSAMGRAVSILQFTSLARLPVYAGNLDKNAFRGTRAELAAQGWFYDFKEHEVATKEQIQDWVASAPIKIDDDGTVWPLQQVLRDIRRRAAGPTADEIMTAVWRGLPDTAVLTPSEVKTALRKVLDQREGS